MYKYIRISYNQRADPGCWLIMSQRTAIHWDKHREIHNEH